MNKFNSWLVDKMAFGLSTIACFYMVTILVVLPLIWKQPQTPVDWMQYLISVLFQGSALPLLGYVSRVAGDKQERLLNETHDSVLAQFQELKETHLVATEELEELKFTHSTMLEELVEIRKIMNLLQGGNEHGK